MALAAHMAKQRALDAFIFPYFFAKESPRILRDDLGYDGPVSPVSSPKPYANANRNPYALNRDIQMSFEFASTPSERNYLFLEDEGLKPFIRLTDYRIHRWSQRGFFLATEDGLKRLGISKKHVYRIDELWTFRGPLIGVGQPPFSWTIWLEPPKSPMPMLVWTDMNA